MAESDDARALRRFAESGDREAWAAVWQQHGEACLRLAMARLGRADLAEDAVQDAVLETLRFARRYTSQRGSVRAFLFGLVSHACTAVRRREERLARRQRVAARSEAGNPSVDAEAQWALREALARLPASLRAVVELRYLAGCDHAEIAAAMRLSEGAVRVRLHRGLERLRVLADAVGLRGATPALCVGMLGALAGGTLSGAAWPGAACDRLVALAARGAAAATWSFASFSALWLALLTSAAAALGLLCAPASLHLVSAPESGRARSVFPIRFPDVPALADPDALADDDDRRAAAASAVADFGARLFAELGREPGNVVLSPWSMQAALSMTMAGARGETLIELRRALCQTTSIADGLVGLGLIDQELAPPDRARSFELRSANRLWPASGFALRADYAALISACFGTEIEALDFTAAPEASRQRINAWVAERTNQLIPELLPSDVIGPDARMVVTNTLWFRGAWSFRGGLGFAPEETRTATFHGRRSAVPVAMMYVKGGLSALAIPQGALVALPFRGGEVEMLLLVPEDRDPASLRGADALAAHVTSATVAAWREAAIPHDVELRLPRFTARQAQRMKQPLRKLGMQRAWSPLQADFSGMHESRDPLFLTEVLHQAMIAIDEHGAVAAAATAVPSGIGSRILPNPTLIVTADKPFLFILRHRSTGIWLMMGRIEEL